ncbi:hypothetical protein ACO0LG_19395 [Undibacterium sp. Ji42W]|uniref:hypothetical protein n=1 Tax=Undibacterium sp. Ji42W TaxID=3413039 RepID=UPI003BF2FCD6
MSLAGKIRVLGFFFSAMGLYEGVGGYLENRDFELLGRNAQVEPLEKISGPASNQNDVRLTLVTERGEKYTVTKSIDQATSQTLHGGRSMRIIYLANDYTKNRWPWEKRDVKMGLVMTIFGFLILAFSYMYRPSK